MFISFPKKGFVNCDLWWENISLCSALLCNKCMWHLPFRCPWSHADVVSGAWEFCVKQPAISSCTALPPFISDFPFHPLIHSVHILYIHIISFGDALGESGARYASFWLMPQKCRSHVLHHIWNSHLGSQTGSLLLCNGCVETKKL